MCRLLLAALPELHVLFIDVDADQKLVAGVMTAGASGMVPDTSDEDDLVEAIETAAAGRTVMSTKALMAILHASHKAVGKDPLADLTALERELFELVGQGLSNAEIATEMRLAPGTVRNYVSAAIAKTRARNRCDAIRIARERGWL